MSLIVAIVRDIPRASGKKNHVASFLRSATPIRGFYGIAPIVFV